MAKKTKFDYFNAFKQLSELAVKESEVLLDTLQNFTTAEALEEPMRRAHEIEHAGDEINHQIYQSVAVDFITPIDREDILSMARSLDDVLDYMEDFIQRCYMYDIHTINPHALEFAELLKKSCQALDEAMNDFAHFKKSKEFRQHIVKVNDCEEEADRLLMYAIRRLCTEEREIPMRVVVWSQLLERMEKCADSCEHVADTMSTVLLKNV